jgi:His-Xaa-Ser system protein HxsD
MAEDESAEHPHLRGVTVEINRDVISGEAILKACHWFSRDYGCEIRTNREQVAEVVLTPRNPAAPFDPRSVKDAFTTSAIDFALREKIEAKTAGIRDLLLAKAFSEAGVLEDRPEGVFGDAIEEAKLDGMFKILGNP